MGTKNLEQIANCASGLQCKNCCTDFQCNANKLLKQIKFPAKRAPADHCKRSRMNRLLTQTPEHPIERQECQAKLSPLPHCSWQCGTWQNKKPKKTQMRRSVVGAANTGHNWTTSNGRSEFVPSHGLHLPILDNQHGHISVHPKVNEEWSLSPDTTVRSSTNSCQNSVPCSGITLHFLMVGQSNHSTSALLTAVDPESSLIMLVLL